MLPLLLMYIPYAQGFISYSYVFVMIVQVSVYDKIINKAYGKKRSIFTEKLQSYLVPTHSVIPMCNKSLFVKNYI